MADLVVVEPDSEPVSLRQARAHLRVTHQSEDALIDSLIQVARQWCEQYLQRPLITQERALYLPIFPLQIEIKKTPVQEIIGIEYVDVDGDAQTVPVATYILDNKSEPARIVLTANASWPLTAPQPSAITVNYRAGYGAANKVPVPIKQAMLLIIGDFYANRENSVVGTIATDFPFGVEALLFAYRLRGFI